MPWAVEEVRIGTDRPLTTPVRSNNYPLGARDFRLDLPHGQEWKVTGSVAELHRDQHGELALQVQFGKPATAPAPLKCPD